VFGATWDTRIGLGPSRAVQEGGRRHSGVDRRLMKPESLTGVPRAGPCCGPSPWAWVSAPPSGARTHPFYSFRVALRVACLQSEISSLGDDRGVGGRSPPWGCALLPGVWSEVEDAPSGVRFGGWLGLDEGLGLWEPWIR
jgi:hypothetical protein